MPEAQTLADVLRRPGYLRLLVMCGAIGMAAFAVAMLRLPLASIVLVTVLLGPADIGVVPLAILAAIAAFVVTELIDPPAPASSGR